MPKSNEKGPLEVLQWLFENESKLPKDRVALLKHVGWVFATRAGMHPNLSDMGYGLMCEMFSELMLRDGGANQAVSGDFAYREHPNGLYSTTTAYRASQQPGWHLARIMQLHNYSEYNGGLFVFTYTMPPPEGHVPPEPNPSPHAMTDLHWQGHRAPVIWDSVCQRKLVFQKFSFTEYMATFELNGVPLYMLETDEPSTYLALESKFRTSSSHSFVPEWELEFVAFAESHPTFVHGRYDARTRVAAVTETDPDALAIRHVIRRFPKEQADLPPYQEARVLHTGWRGLDVRHCFDYLIEDDNRANLGVEETAHTVADLVRSMEHIANLVASPRHAPDRARKGAHIGRALTEAMRSRIFRIAYKFLLTMGENAEQRRAADPVKKCAACAIQAAKSQLVLGIEGPNAKRQRA